MLVRGTPILAATSAQNGVIYVINKVLVEGATSSNVLTEIERRPELSMFYSLLQRSSLVQKLQGKRVALLIAGDQLKHTQKVEGEGEMRISFCSSCFPTTCKLQ